MLDKFERQETDACEFHKNLHVQAIVPRIIFNFQKLKKLRFPKIITGNITRINCFPGSQERHQNNGLVRA